MRHEVRCTKCTTNVLVVDVDAETAPGGGVQPKADDLSRRIAAHGWRNNAQGPVCTDCQSGYKVSKPDPAPPVPAAGRKGGKRE